MIRNGNKIWQELVLVVSKSVHISLVLAILLSDCLTNELGWICQLLNLSSQLDNSNWRITKKCFVLFSLWCKKVTLVIKEKTLKQKMVRSKCLNNLWSQSFRNIFHCMKNCWSQFSLFCYSNWHKWTTVFCNHSKKYISKMISSVWFFFVGVC